MLAKDKEVSNPRMSMGLACDARRRSVFLKIWLQFLDHDYRYDRLVWIWSNLTSHFLRADGFLTFPHTVDFM